MSDTIRAARVAKTGALIPLHEGNMTILDRNGVEEVEAKRDKDTGRLHVAGGGEYVNLVSASKDLPRIADALRENHAQRERLLTSGLKLPKGEQFLMQEGVYDGKKDRQYIDPDSLHEPIEIPDDPDGISIDTVEIADVTEDLRQEAKAKKTANKTADSKTDNKPDKKADKKADNKAEPDLSDL